MLERDAKVILFSLKIHASLDHLAIRLLYWATLVYCTWIILSTASFVLDYGQLNFHVIFLSTLTLLPLFLLIPSSGRSFIKTLRPFDIQTTIESYISTTKTKITKFQEKQTEETLRIVSMKKFVKSKPGSTWTICFAGSTLLFMVFQVVSLKTGQGFFSAYVERLQKPVANSLQNKGSMNEYGFLSIDKSSINPEAAKTAKTNRGARDLKKEKIAMDEENFPSLVTGDKEKSSGFQDTKGPEESSGPLTQQEIEPGKSGGNNKNTDSKENAPEKKETDTSSQNPGYEGTGTALQNNPLVAYTAYFERLFLEHSGKQTALSQVQTEAEFTDLIASYYSSFATIVDIKLQKDSKITAAKQSWLSAFPTKAQE